MGAFANTWALDSIIPSFIGSATALVVFYLSTRTDRNVEKRKKNEEQSDKIHYLKSLIKNVLRVTEQQIRYTKEYNSKILEKDTELALMTFLPLTAFVRATDALSKEDYFKAFNIHYKNKFDTIQTFEGICSNIDFIHANLQEIPNILERLMKSDYEQKVKYQGMIDKIISLLGILLVTVRRNMRPPFELLEGDYLKFVEGLKDYTNISYYHEALVIPVNNFFVDYLSNPTNPISDEILSISELSRNTKQLFDVIKKSNQDVKKQFDEIIDALVASSNELAQQNNEIA